MSSQPVPIRTGTKEQMIVWLLNKQCQALAYDETLHRTHTHDPILRVSPPTHTQARARTHTHTHTHLYTQSPTNGRKRQSTWTCIIIVWCHRVAKEVKQTVAWHTG